MTEVRPTTFTSNKNNNNNNDHLSNSSNTSVLGLFATKEYNVGDVIIDYEDVLIPRLEPKNEQEENELCQFLSSSNDTTTVTPSKEASVTTNNNNNNSTTRYLDMIVPPPEVDTIAKQTKFKHMVQIGLSYLLHIDQHLSIEQKTDLFQLYHPNIYNNNNSKNSSHIDSTLQEKGLLELSTHAVNYIKHVNNLKHNEKNGKEEQEVDWNVIQHVILIWSCNSFHGGRIYKQISRINHSCNPNSIVQVKQSNERTNSEDINNDNDNSNNNNNNKQRIVAATSIRIGDEITISYLGIFLYSDTRTRRYILSRDKGFHCICQRCIGIDTASAIPCPLAHPRTGQQLLQEDDQYDDEQTVQYTYPMILPPTNNGHNNDDNVVYYISDTKQQCSSNDPKLKKLFHVMQSVVDKVVLYLENNNFDQVIDTKQVDGNQNKTNNKNNKDETKIDVSDNIVQIEQLEQYIQLSSSVLGCKHWTTNILLLIRLNQKLQLYHTTLLQKTLRAHNTNNDDDDEQEEDPSSINVLGEMIDMMQRIERFVIGLELNIHMGHLVSDVIIGIARALVSLGDMKSQQYASEWLDKIMVQYVQIFEPIGKQKVVTTLHSAWQQQQVDGKYERKRDVTASTKNEDNENDTEQKRAKSSK